MGKAFAAVAADDAHGGAGDDANNSGDGERVALLPVSWFTNIPVTTA